MKKMIKHVCCVAVLMTGTVAAQAQTNQIHPDVPVFQRSAEKTAPLAGVVDLKDNPQDLNPLLFSEEIEDQGNGMVTAPFVRSSTVSPYYREDIPAGSNTMSKAGAEAPNVFRSFNGASDNQYTPPDNNITVSNAGYVLSVMNSNYRIFAPGSNKQAKYSSFKDALSNIFTNIKDVYYDPRVIYDAENDRFILVVLNGITSDATHIVVLFSKTNNPEDGWNAYDLSGDIFGKGEWTDYPNIGISKSDLFITGNEFDNSGNAIEPAILQINKNDGYSGSGTLHYSNWEIVKKPIGQPTQFSYVPASHGLGKDYGDSMYFVCNILSGGTTMHVMEITGSQASGSAKINFNNIYAYKAFAYSNVSASAQKGSSVTLAGGDARVKQAFYLNKTIHYVFATSDQFTGYGNIVYGRFDVSNQTLDYRELGLTGYTYDYPSIQSIGLNEKDARVLIGYCKSGSSIYPEIDAVHCDASFTFSASVNISAGVSSVSGSSQTSRWGDYTGLARQYTTNQCYFAGHYGNGGAYQTWLAEIGLKSTYKSGINNEIPAAATTATVYPNPVTDIFSVDFETESSTRITINLYDMNGRLVSELFEGTRQKGDQKFTFNKAALAPGIYHLNISTTDGGNISRKIVVN